MAYQHLSWFGVWAVLQSERLQRASPQECGLAHDDAFGWECGRDCPETNDLGKRDSHVLPALSPNADHRRKTFGGLWWFCCNAARKAAPASVPCASKQQCTQSVALQLSFAPLHFSLVKHSKKIRNKTATAPARTDTVTIHN